MHKKKLSIMLALVVLPIISLNSVAFAYTTLKEGMNGNAVASLQKDLKTLGCISFDPTWNYGGTTVWGVSNFQSKYGLKVDGIAGTATFAMIDKLLGRNITTTSRGTIDRKTTADYALPWFGNVENFFARGDIADVYDIDSGLSFRVKRSYGTYHADCEPLTAADTATMKKIYGQWSWQRRAIIVTVKGKKIAASMNGMPHAGDEDAPANQYVNWRSAGYGAGINLDSVKGNKMDGHFCIHFLNSKTHVGNNVDPAHQAMVAKAAKWAVNNLK